MRPSPATAPRSFLLRLWPGDETSWRCSLRDLASGERRGFASPDELAAFLATGLAGPPASRVDSAEGGGDAVEEHLHREGDEEQAHQALHRQQAAGAEDAVEPG